MAESHRRRRSEADESRGPAAFAEQTQAFLNTLALERGLSPHTRAAYRRDLDQASAFLSRQGATDWRDVTAAQAGRWLHELTRNRYAVASLARKRTALRMLARFLVREGARADDFTALLGSPRSERRIPGTLTEGEILRLLAAPTGGDPAALRDRAILELFYSSGLRVSELAGLKLQQVDLDNGFLRVFGKGSKERVVPFGGKAREALEAYLAAGRPGFVSSRTGSPFFLNGRGGALSRVGLWMIVKKHARRAGLADRVKPHSLRHSFASHLLAGGADLRAIQEMLGHASISTTQIYTAVEPRRLQEHHAKYHPRKHE